MKKKQSVTSKDKKDWTTFTKSIGNLYDKDEKVTQIAKDTNRVRKLDLHGFSLLDANKAVKNFIIESFELGCKKILVVTGKGLRSKIDKDPYRSSKMSTLKNSIPEYIKNDTDLAILVNKISTADQKDGGEGAINIYLKSQNKF